MGSVLHYPANPDRVLPEELWLFELEFVDDKVTEAQVTTFFQRLEASLPRAPDGTIALAARAWAVRGTREA